MNKKQQFLGFLDGLKGHGQDALVESVKKGFVVCMEADIDEKIKQEQEDTAWGKHRSGELYKEEKERNIKYKKAEDDEKLQNVEMQKKIEKEAEENNLSDSKVVKISTGKGTRDYTTDMPNISKEDENEYKYTYKTIAERGHDSNKNAFTFISNSEGSSIAHLLWIDADLPTLSKYISKKGPEFFNIKYDTLTHIIFNNINNATITIYTKTKFDPNANLDWDEYFKSE
jgi:hypothetical protein